MSKTADTKFRLRAVDKMSKTLDKVRSRFAPLNRALQKTTQRFRIVKYRSKGFTDGLNKMGKKMRSVGRSASVGLSAPIALAGGAMIRTSLNFTKSINRVGALTQTIVGKKVAPEFAKLEEKALSLGKTTAFSSTQVADAMGFLAQAGFSTNQILEAIPSTLDLAAASNTDLAATADIASNIMGAFNIKASEMGRVADVLALTTAKTNVNMEQLADTMKFVAPVANEAGASLEETAALTGLLGNVGIQGSTAATALKNAYLNLASPTSKAAGFLKDMGVAVQDGNGDMLRLTDILGHMGPVISKLGSRDRIKVLTEIFGKRAVAGASALMQRTGAVSDSIENMNQILLGARGASKDMSEALLRGPVGAAKRFESALEGLSLQFTKEGGALDAFIYLAEAGIKLFESFNQLSPATKKLITIGAALLAVLGPFLILLGSMASAASFLWPILATGIPILWGLVAPILTALAPIILIIAKFALLAAGLWAVWKVGVMIGQLLTDLFTQPTKALDNFLNRFKNGFGSISGFFKTGGGFISSIFGGQDDSLNAGLNRRVGLEGNAGGPSNGFAPRQTTNREFVSRTQNARVDVNIRAPEQTDYVTRADSDGAFLDLKTGPLGAL